MLYTLLQVERRANSRLRRELLEWQNKTLQQARIPPLFTPPPKPVEPISRPPIGATAKRAYLAEHTQPNLVPSAEEILAQAEKAQNGNK